MYYYKNMDTDTGPSSSQIPDLIRIGAVSTDTAINVQTDLLDAVIFSQREARFVLENKGILHSNSRITLATDGTGVPAGRSFFPANVGINSLIQRASLRVGTKTVCEIEDFADFCAYETTFLPPDAIKEREQVMSGRFMSVQAQLQERSASFAAGVSTESLTEAKSISIDNGKNALLLSDFGGTLHRPITSAAIPEVSGTIWDFQNEPNKPTFSILLADLFPFLKVNQLPLFMMSEQVSIHLTFTPIATSGLESKRVCVTNCDAVALTADATITRNDCQMVADYIFYPQEMMEQYRQQNSTMTFNYVDYQFMKRTVSAAEYAAGLIQNVGGAGRIVNKVFVAVATDIGLAESLLNDYVAGGPAVTAQTTGVVTTNIKYNDNFLYPVDVSNDARHYHNVFQSEGRVPYISRDLYRGEGRLATDQTLTPGSVDFEGYDAEDNLQQRMFYTAYRMNKGERINSRGIELYDTRSGMPGTQTLRAWLQVMRMATLRDGVLEIAYA